MDSRKYAADAAASPPSPPASPSVGYPTNGNPVGGTPATWPGDYWFYSIGEELRNVIIDAGLTPDINTVTQVRDAIRQIINQGPVKTPVRLAATTNINIASPGANFDSVAANNGDRILLPVQTTPSQNGFWIFNGAAVPMTRATDADGVGELYGGMMVTVQEGTLYADTVWEIATPTGAITPGTTSLTFQQIVSGQASATGSFKNLQASSTGLNANVTLTADEAVLKAGAGQYKTVESVNLTIAGTANGANGLDTGALATSTWYSLWVIWNGATVAGLMSLSATSPTMPGGYTHKARVGWVRTDGTANKYPISFTQSGKSVEYKLSTGSNLTAYPTITSGVTGNIVTPTWTAVSVSNFVPPTASKIGIILAAGNNGAAIAAVPNNSFGAPGMGSGSVANPVELIAISDTSGITRPVSGNLLLQSTNIYVATSATNNTVSVCTGWEDNI